MAVALPSTAHATASPLVRLPDQAAPEFELDSMSGGRLSLADTRGRIVLLHFFATWCEPCRPEMASLDRLAQRMRGESLSILAVSVAEAEARLTRFFVESPVGFPILLDRDRKASRAWGVEALPTTFVLGRDLRQRLFVRGDLDWQRPDVEAEIASLLAEPDRPTLQRNESPSAG